MLDEPAREILLFAITPFVGVVAVAIGVDINFSVEIPDVQKVLAGVGGSILGISLRNSAEIRRTKSDIHEVRGTVGRIVGLLERMTDRTVEVDRRVSTLEENTPPHDR